MSPTVDLQSSFIESEAPELSSVKSEVKAPELNPVKSEVKVANSQELATAQHPLSEYAFTRSRSISGFATPKGGQQHSMGCSKQNPSFPEPGISGATRPAVIRPLRRYSHRQVNERVRRVRKRFLAETREENAIRRLGLHRTNSGEEAALRGLGLVASGCSQAPLRTVPQTRRSRRQEERIRK